MLIRTARKHSLDDHGGSSRREMLIRCHAAIGGGSNEGQIETDRSYESEAGEVRLVGSNCRETPRFASGGVSFSEDLEELLIDNGEGGAESQAARRKPPCILVFGDEENVL